MCGSLLSKFKRRSNIVVPVSSAESLTQERVKESISEDAKTVRWALPSANSNLPSNNILEGRPYDSTTEKYGFPSSPSAHSTADKSEKQTEAEIRCAPESESTCVEDHAKQRPDFGSTIQWNPSSNLQERKSVSVCLTARSVSEKELCQDKTETISKVAAGSKEVETEPDSKFKDDDDSESSIKEISAKPSSKSTAAYQISDGKIKNANQPRCRSASCLNGSCSEPRAAFMVKKDSFACIQLTTSTDRDSVLERELCQDKTETKSKAAAGSKEVETEPDSRFKDDDDSESSIKEISAKPSSKSAAGYQISDGKIKNANQPRCRSASCLNGSCSEPRAAFMVKKDSFACIQLTTSTDRDSVLERELCQDKTETKSKAAAGSKEVETEPDSRFKDDDDSESSIKEISAKPSSKSAAGYQISDGKIKNANQPRCRSASCLNGSCSEPRAACMVKNDSIACIQPTTSTNRDSNSTNKRDSETDEKEDRIEPDKGTNVCLECCETRCESRRLTTKADSQSLIDCNSAAGLDGKGSEIVLQPVSGCDSVVRLKKNATEPATEPNIECHLNAWAQEKDTNTVFQSEMAIKSCGRITEKQAFTDCKPAINRRRASFLCDRDFGCAADYVSEARSEADARIAPIVMASDSTAAQNDSDANLESKVGKLCCNIITRKPFCPLVQEKKETEQNSEDTKHGEHPPTAQIVMANIEHNNTCLAEVASCPQFELKTEVDSKPDFYCHSAAKVTKSVPEAGNQSEVRCDSKASMRATSTHLDAVTIEKHVKEKDILIKQTQEKEASSSDPEVLSSGNSGSNGQKRPAHTKSFPSASASAVAFVQDEPHTAFSNPKEDAMSVHASAVNEDGGRRLENDLPNHGTDLKISRQIIIKGVAKVTKEEMATEKSDWDNPSTSQRHSESAVTPGKLDVLFERARKELEERILKVRNSEVLDTDKKYRLTNIRKRAFRFQL